MKLLQNKTALVTGASKGVKAKGYRSDASNFAQADKLINDVVSEFGSLDILVNNAGITMDNLLLRMTEEMWDKVINVNLKSCFNTVKAATKPMMKQKGGSIINMTSVVGSSLDGIETRFQIHIYNFIPHFFRHAQQ